MGTDLKFIPINDINLVPRYLIDQVKDKEFETEQFYEMGPGILKNPFCVAGVFADLENEVKGFLIGNANPLTMWFTVWILSIDKKYFGKGIITETKNIIQKKIIEPGKLKGMQIFTTRPKAFEKEGFKGSKHILMELK